MFGFIKKPHEEELKQLKMEHKQFKIENKELKKQVDKLMIHIQTLEKERILFKRDIEISHKELENTEKELNAKSKQFLSLEKENKELKTKLDEAEQVNVKLQNIINRLNIGCWGNKEAKRQMQLVLRNQEEYNRAELIRAITGFELLTDVGFDSVFVTEELRESLKLHDQKKNEQD